MCLLVLKFRNCSNQAQQIWATGSGGNSGLMTVGQVYRLANFTGVPTPGGMNFGPAPANPTVPIPGTSSFTLNSTTCWELVQVTDSCDEDKPWLLNGGITVNGFSVLTINTTCIACVGPTPNTDCDTTTNNSTSTCNGSSNSSSSGCQNKDCSCQTTNDICLTPPPDCGDECDDCACEEAITSQCVIYNGPKIECLGINPGMSMNQVMALIGSNLCNLDIETTCTDVTCSNNAPGCTSPLDLIFKPFIDTVIEANITDPDDISGLIRSYFDAFFKDGIIRTNDCNTPICCQECCDDKFYFLGAAQLGFAFFELTQYPSCCANSSFSSSIAMAGNEILNEAISATLLNILGTWEKINANSSSVPVILGTPNPLIFGNTKQCCTDGSFQSCLESFYDHINQEQDLVDAGIVESQYAGNQSLICGLNEYFDQMSMSPFTTNHKIDIARYFIENGLIVACCNNQIFIGSTQTFSELIIGGTISSCIEDKIAPTFDFGPFCKDAEIPLPTTTSLEGITGSWLEAGFDTSEVGEFTLTFIPDPGQNAYNVSVTYEIVAGFTANDLTLTACEDSASSGIATVDLTSENTAIYATGETYTWYSDLALTTLVPDPTLVEIDVNGGVVTFYCLVEDENGCTSVGSAEYTPVEFPLFVDNAISGVDGCLWSLEQGQVAPALPASDNGIAGTWSPAVIDTTTTGTFNYTFTPTNGCPSVIRPISIYPPATPPC